MGNPSSMNCVGMCENLHYCCCFCMFVQATVVVREMQSCSASFIPDDACSPRMFPHPLAVCVRS